MPDLIEAARTARDQAYAPYSGYRVGAVIRSSDGGIWTGCNVEIASYPLGVCAERNAVAAMVAGGGREIVEIVVATADGRPPCGGCLQVLVEFSSDPAKTVVRLVSEEREELAYKLVELLPHAFHLDRP